MRTRFAGLAKFFERATQFGNRTRAQIISITKSTRKYDHFICFWNDRIFMPVENGFNFWMIFLKLFKNFYDVVVTIRSWKLHHRPLSFSNHHFLDLDPAPWLHSCFFGRRKSMEASGDLKPLNTT